MKASVAVVCLTYGFLQLVRPTEGSSNDTSGGSTSAGIAVGVVGGTLVIGATIFNICWKSRRARKRRDAEAAAANPEQHSGIEVTRRKLQKPERQVMTEQSGNQLPESNLQVAAELSTSTEVSRKELPESEGQLRTELEGRRLPAEMDQGYRKIVRKPLNPINAVHELS